MKMLESTMKMLEAKIKTPERRQERLPSGVFITWNRFHTLF